MNFIRENKLLVAVALFVTMAIPIAVGYIVQLPVFTMIAGDNSDWIGFWGSYVGGLISVIATFWIASFVSKEEFKRQTETEKKQAIENFKIELRIDVLKELLVKIKELDALLEALHRRVFDEEIQADTVLEIETLMKMIVRAFKEKIISLDEYIILDSQIIGDVEFTKSLSTELYKVEELYLYAQKVLAEDSENLEREHLFFLADQMVTSPVTIQQRIYEKIYEILA